MFPLNATVYCRFVWILDDLELTLNCSRVLLARKLLTGLGAVKSVCYCSGFHGRSRSLSMGITSATFCTLLPRR